VTNTKTVDSSRTAPAAEETPATSRSANRVRRVQETTRGRLDRRDRCSFRKRNSSRATSPAPRGFNCRTSVHRSNVCERCGNRSSRTAVDRPKRPAPVRRSN
jgi:hypothetical protein